MGALERGGEFFAVVLRIVTGTRNGTYIYQALDSVRFKHIEEFCDRTRRMADGIYPQIRFLLFSAVTSGADLDSLTEKVSPCIKLLLDAKSSNFSRKPTGIPVAHLPSSEAIA